ncbi:winged helix DNA-binding domain-containing protein [Actinacidiphila acidipaludis]|uniref:Winged helix DNA-binding domain-containing protein n=1 Tax=Actinacidiphila acidipaludis TaxID=2873382 RepID=A0ABS7Q5P9_9ACTN|nr:winged helix DNA-binding domain-containing protein [Streptomyces acidipaludis]MBY8878427.1 winged helix DNA-binding domain-containing protein [Streptomyces acidipaludis]
MGNLALDRRTLNRTLLDRQMLLRRAAAGTETAVARLLGLQSQVPSSPYLGLWTRLEDFDFAEPGTLLTERRLVRLVAMRGTVHLMTAADALRLRAWTQPALDRTLRTSTWAPGFAGVDLTAVAAYGRALLAEQPMTPGELRGALGARWPDARADSLLQALRVCEPLVQVPPRGLWGASGGVRYALLGTWVGEPGGARESAGEQDGSGGPGEQELVRRYLAAFGPATPADMQKWSGRTGLRKAFAALELRAYTAEDDGRVLYDLPEAVLADPATEVPARFVADFDNLLLSHADRTRVLATADKNRVITVNGLVSGTILVDGFVGGTWQFDKEARDRGAAAVVVTPFAPLTGTDWDALEREGARLLAAAHPGLAHSVRFTAPR